ncbi:Ser-Thr-rich GPI-anchored membrane family protein [Streptomyces sp. NPDC102406]|uniref:Ser-Thr-rich GPI-anchored membrane family protein n=1 Tax=Streptomyces sp. NPDC102406 TaxID=3366171 RepID=UPI0037FB5AF9
MRRTGFLALAVAPLLFAFGPATEAGPAVTVTAPSAGSVYPSGGSVLVAWRNSTGREVDMWLVRDKTARVAQLAAKLSAAPSGEKAAVLPDVPQGSDYAIEVVARDGGEHAYSPSFTVGRRAHGAPSS